MLAIAHVSAWYFVVGLVLILAFMGVGVFLEIKQKKLEKQKEEEKK